MSDPLARFQSRRRSTTIEEDGRRYRIRPDGQRVELVSTELDPPDPPAGRAPKKKKKEKFAKMELDRLAKMAEAAGCPCAVILAVLTYLHWQAGGKPFAFSNVLLSGLGIHRQTKYRMLETLEATGQIKVEHRGTGRAPIVTLL